MIINNLATIVNNTLNNLFSNGIHFYQILIGEFIFNFIIYLICKIIKIAKYQNYGGILW